MNKIDEAIDRIKALECPTGDIENRVAEILEDYRVTDSSKVNILRDSKLDSEDAQAYRVEIPGKGQSIVVMAKSGYDDYVAKVTDVYSKP
jgi:hypothetical protein